MVRILVDHTPSYIQKWVSPDDYLNYYGVLVTPGTNRGVQHVAGVTWAIDNGGYNGVNERAFFRLLAKYQPYADTCSWVVAPDVWGNSPKTFQQFMHWRKIIAGCGYPVALAVQDGTELLLDKGFYGVEWQMFDALFIGGTDKYRDSGELKDLISEAKRRGKTTHLGRVNTPDGLRRAGWLGVDTCDGSSFARFAAEKTAMADKSFNYKQLQLLKD